MARPAIVLIVLAASAAAQLNVVPTDLQQPGTQPGEVQNLQPISKCDNCHGGYDAPVEPAHNWRGSMMGQATRDPLFWATVAVAEQDFGGAGDLCLRCHTPDGWIDGRSTPTDGSTLASGHADGVSCDACHRMTNPDLSEWLGVQNAPFVANDGGDPPTGYYGTAQYVLWPNTNEKLGPYADAVPNHGFMPSEFHRDAAFCGTCHDVSNPAVGDLAHNFGAQTPLAPGTYSGVPGAPVDQKAAFNNFPYAYGVVERTFSEHQASAWAGFPLTQFDDLPADLKAGSVQRAYDAAIAANPGPVENPDYVDGATRTFSCQTCHMRPVTGAGCDKAAAPTRTDLPHHDMTGGNVWVPDALAYLDGQDDLVVGGGLGADALAALADGKARALQNLQDAATLAVDGDVVRVTNLTGHKLISGFPEGRRMWLNVRWFDGGGGLLREDGAYGDLAVEIDGAPATVRTLLDLDETNTRVWDAHFGLTQEWANQLLSLGWPSGLALGYDRLDGTPDTTLGDLGAQAPGTHAESFHFVLNNVLIEDDRIPPWGLDRDLAAQRNVLPVPDTQFGNPGAGGVYEHWEDFALDPPVGAATATIDLLYQTTSWEYVQFLHLANDGSVAFLADTGEHILEAWLATGMAEPVVMASAVWSAGVDPWADLGFALAGTHGAPTLVGDGPLTAGSPLTLTLSNALENTQTTLIIGLTALFAPFKGGTLVPAPTLLVSGLPTGPTGTLALPAVWPAGVPAGTVLYFQHWIVDPAGPKNLAASNGVSGTAQ